MDRFHCTQVKRDRGGKKEEEKAEERRTDMVEARLLYKELM